MNEEEKNVETIIDEIEAENDAIIEPETEDDVREAFEINKEDGPLAALGAPLIRALGDPEPADPNMIQKHLDNFLAKIAGETPIDENVRDSTEYWLNRIAEAGGGGTMVIANPELVGTENALTGLQVGDTKYKIDAPVKYQHNVCVDVSGSEIYFILITDRATLYTDISQFIDLITNFKLVPATGYFNGGFAAGVQNSGGTLFVIGSKPDGSSISGSATFKSDMIL